MPAPLFLPGDLVYGRVSGLKNCSPFFASAEAVMDEQSKFLGLQIMTYTESDTGYAAKEYLGIGIAGIDTGEWPLMDVAIHQLEFSGYFTVKGQGEIEDSFALDKSYAFNRIAITKINLNSGSVQGFFDARFVLTSSDGLGTNPDTIEFFDCHFNAIDPP